ncbi:MAG: polynucleotide kinase-phosphatase, partial [Pseudomonadota bacterium]
SAQQDNDRLLYFDDFARKQRIETRLGGSITIPEENALAALEVMSRFGADPRWVIHLPPTMAACPTAPDGPYLEHPAQALEFYAERGVTELVVEEKHMGSRALCVVTRDAEAAARRFGTEDGKAGVIYTRTGRPFFTDDEIEAALIARLAEAAGRAGLWEALETDWLLLDTELMPWSAKAQELLRRQYRPTVAAARHSAEILLTELSVATHVEGLEDLRAAAADRLQNATAMGQAIDGYCWRATGVEDYRLAPFHILAAEGAVLTDRPHGWHMETIGALCADDPVLRETGWRKVDPSSARDRAAVTEWWLSHTGKGGEGFVMKPDSFVARGERGLIQPAMKVRGRDYLRIIYGPDYDATGNIERLRKRGLGRKFSLAEREFRLGHEGLHRFVENMPLSRVHECALAVLALESEPVDPRL